MPKKSGKRLGSAQHGSVERFIKAFRDLPPLSDLARHGGLDDLVKEVALPILNADYYSDVRGITSEIISEVKSGEIRDREQLDEAIHMKVDGTQRVIYTFQAKLGLISTDNYDAYEEDFGEKPAGPEQAMFAALERDVREQLDAEGIDDMLER